MNTPSNPNKTVKTVWLRRRYQLVLLVVVPMFAYCAVSWTSQKFCDQKTEFSPRVVRSVPWNGGEVVILNKNPFSLGLGTNNYDVAWKRMETWADWTEKPPSMETTSLCHPDEDTKSVIREIPSVTVNKNNQLVVKYTDVKSSIPCEMNIVYTAIPSN